MLTTILIATLSQSAPAAPAQAAEAAPTLTIGSKAPIPEVATFAKGTAPTFFEPGKTYVVEFWATWCAPCRASMPHLSDLSDKYKGTVTFVGISSEEAPVVEQFLAKPEWQEKVRYTIGVDTDRSTSGQYMEAAGENGIPTAFIVKDGTVQWIGHPMSMDKPLEDITAGTWDIATAAKERETEKAAEMRSMASRRAMTSARRKGDWTEYFRLIDDEIAKSPSEARVGWEYQKFTAMITAAQMPKEGYELGERIMKETDDPSLLNAIAWTVLDDKNVGDRNFAFALAAATKANDASGGKDMAILDTLARAYWDSGDKAKAIEYQEKAAAAAGDDEMGKDIKETLERYRKEAGSATN